MRRFEGVLPFPYSVPTVAAFSCILLLMIGAIISACDSSGGNSNNGEALVPLEEGNSWTAKSDEGRLSISVNSEGDAEIFETPPGFYIEEDTPVLIEKESDGLMFGLNLQNRDNFFLKFPAESGDTYQYTDAAGAHNFEVTVSRQTLNVPAGEFDTLVYTIRQTDFSGEPIQARVYIEPGFGPVRYNQRPEFPEFGSDFQLVGSNVDS